MLGKTNVKVKPNKKKPKIDYVEYIESTGTQYIDTGIKISSGHKVKLKFEDAALLNDADYFSGLESTYKNRFRLAIYNGLFVGSTLNATSSYSFYNTNVSKNTLYEAELYAGVGEQYCSINNEKIYTSTSTSLGSSNYNLFLCAGNKDGTAVNYSKIKLYSCQIYNGDTLVRDFRPVKDGAGVYCLYDEVEKRYYYNQGSGEFLGGVAA